MKKMPTHKYRPYPTVDLHDRKWPSKNITKAPIWCSVDLRDGNQALIDPMTLEQKLELFKLLVAIGFKEIEVGFPSASQTEFEFTRMLIEKKLIPDDVSIQVLTQAREHLIEKTYEAIQGVKKAVVHVYNSVSELQRRVVFKKDCKEIKEIAVHGAELLKKYAEKMKESDITFEYSPESFTGAELEYALEVCEAVLAVWKPTPKKKAIINLPATVEMSTPNIYADRIEWFLRNLKQRENVILSLHTHNDRGTGVAASELGLLAGADRVEGTLFGNGERTGNCDLTTMALNLFSQGIDPGLDLTQINEVKKIHERCTKIPVHPRHPYAGELVYTAFSGSHQDAISKGMHAHDTASDGIWDVPYLPIDPQDVGRTYESIIRINSQSGKGGVAYIMEQEYGVRLPKAMHPEFGEVIKDLSDKKGVELPSKAIWEALELEYLKKDSPLTFQRLDKAVNWPIENVHGESTRITATVVIDGVEKKIEGIGNGPLDAFASGLEKNMDMKASVLSYEQHAIQQGTNATAIAYIQVTVEGEKCFGAAVDKNISVAAMKALVSALNRIGTH